MRKGHFIIVLMILISLAFSGFHGLVKADGSDAWYYDGGDARVWADPVTFPSPYGGHQRHDGGLDDMFHWEFEYRVEPGNKIRMFEIDGAELVDARSGITINHYRFQYGVGDVEDSEGFKWEFSVGLSGEDRILS